MLELMAGNAWGGALLAFFAGVRRGLTFSERGGAARFEVTSFLALFFVAAVGLAASQPLLLALGFLAAGWLDLRAARKGEAPAYFTGLRPAQAVVAAVSLVSLAARFA